MRHVERPRYLHERDRVACVHCRHFVPDDMGGGGIGDCKIGEGARQKTCLYPHRERICQGFSVITQDTVTSSVPRTKDDDVSHDLILGDKIAYNDTCQKDHSSESLVQEERSIDPALVGIAYVRKPVKKYEFPQF